MFNSSPRRLHPSGTSGVKAMCHVKQFEAELSSFVVLSSKFHLQSCSQIIMAERKRVNGPVGSAIKTNDKPDEEFRVYHEATSPARVVNHYKDMRINQTVAFYRKMEQNIHFSIQTFQQQQFICKG